MEEPRDPKPDNLEYARPVPASPKEFAALGRKLAVLHWIVAFLLLANIGYEGTTIGAVRKVAVYVLMLPLFLPGWLVRGADWLWPLVMVPAFVGNSLLYGFAIAYVVTRVRRWRSRA